MGFLGRFFSRNRKPKIDISARIIDKKLVFDVRFPEGTLESDVERLVANQIREIKGESYFPYEVHYNNTALSDERVKKILRKY